MTAAESLHLARVATWDAHRAAMDVPDAATRHALDTLAEALMAVVVAHETAQRGGASHAAA